MTLEEIVRKILEEKRNLTRRDVLRMVEERARKTGGLLTLESAARTVASDLGVKFEEGRLKPKILIRNLVPGLSNVTVAGRVLRVHPVRKFKRRDGSEGTVGRLTIADESGKLRVLLWDEKANILESGDDLIGKVVKFSHGYVREGLDGSLELNVGARGSVEVSPPDLPESEVPPLEKFMKKIGEITVGDREVNVSGVVRGIYPTVTFQREDGSEGRVRRIELEDSTGRVTLVLWNEKVDEVDRLKSDIYVEVFGASARETVDGTMELHVESGSHIRVMAGKPLGLKEPRPTLRVRDLKPKMHDVKILVRVLEVGKVREFTRQDGVGRFLPLLVGDETGLIQLNLWDDKVELERRLHKGDVVLLDGAYVSGRKGTTTLNLGARGRVTISPGLEGPQPPKERILKVGEDLVEEGGPVTVEGLILTKPSLKEVVTNRGESVRVASFMLGDGEERVEVSLWRDIANSVESLTVGDRVKIRNIYVRYDFSGRPKIVSGALTTLKKVDS